MTGRLVDGEGEPLGAHLEDGRTGDDGRIDMCIPQGRCRTLFFEDEDDFRVLAELDLVEGEDQETNDLMLE